MVGETSQKRSSDGQSIARAAQVLRAVADQPGASLGQIAKATDLPRSTVQRLVGALNSEGLLTKTFGEQGVYLGMELARLGGRVNIDARSLLRPLIQELHDRTGENCDLTVLEDGKVIVIEQFASNEHIRVISHVGRQHPIHCTANGKAHLSQLDHDEALALIGPDPVACTTRTETDPHRLMKQIEAARDKGLFHDREEYADDTSAIGIALPDIGGQPLALAVAMPEFRFARKEKATIEALLAFRASVDGLVGRR